MATETANQEQELQSEALTVQQKLGLVKIVDQPSYDYAASLLMDIKGFRKRWSAYWEPLREGAYDSYKAILNKIKERDDPMAAAEGAVKRSLLQWDDQQRRLQEQRQREAQEKAEADEAARRAQLAFEMEESGAEEAEIEQVVSAPIVAVAPPVESYQKASGVSRRENWKARVVDMKKLCKAIAAGKVPVDYVEANFTALNARARADKSTMNVPGVEAYDDPIIAGRTK